MSPLGIAGTCISATAMLGCCAPGVLGPTAAVLIPLVAWLPSSVHYESLYGSVGVTLVGLVVSAIRYRCIPSLVLGIAGAVALLLALHEAWDMRIFRTLMWSGALTLMLVGIADARATISRRPWRAWSAACAT